MKKAHPLAVPLATLLVALLVAVLPLGSVAVAGAEGGREDPAEGSAPDPAAPEEPPADDKPPAAAPSPVNGTPDGEPESGAETSSFLDELSPQQLALFIALPGIFGGLLFAMRGKSLELPYLKSSHSWAPGVIGDCLFGLAGGGVIFLVVPWQFPPADNLALLKTVALALVGGYGGRALVEKVLADQLKQLADRVDEAEEQGKIDSRATQLVEQHLDEDVAATQVSEEELRQKVAGASLTARQAIFEKTRLFRKDAFPDRRDLLPRVVPVLEGLIAADTEKQFHRNHGQLGYALKDMEPPDLKRAETQFATAIKIRDQRGVKGYPVYEYSRAECLIRLDAPVDEILAALQPALDWDKIAERLTGKDDLAKDIADWAKKNQARLNPWLEQNAAAFRIA